MTPTFDDLVAEGLFDPGAPDADVRRKLLERALAVGAGLDEIRHACEEGWLHVVPTRVAILGAPPTLSVEEAAARAGMAPELAARLWHILRLDQRGYRDCVDDDVAIFELYAGVLSMFGEEETLQIAAVQGAAVAMMADAEVAQVRALLEAPQRDVGADNVAVGDMWVEFVRDFFAVVERGIARLHRHQILATGRRYTLWGAPTEESTAEIVVGFADLVGFSALGQTLDLRQVDALLRTFEARAAGTATSAGSRLVKLIGDEAMFVAGTADDALGIARALVYDPDLPALRVGIAAGRVVTRGGDVFGVPVNLAARLVATAQPGEILVDAAAAVQASGTITLVHRGARELPGFETPVDVFAVSSAEG